MQNLYLTIVKTINDNKKRFTELGIEPIRTIDIYNGQPENPAQFEFLSPALFIDYGIDWERGGSAYKQGVITVNVHVLTDPRPGTEDWSGRIDDGLKKMLYYSLVSELLESVSSVNTGSLYLIGENPNQTDYFDYHVLTFDTSIARQKGQLLLSVENVKAQINAKSN